MTSENGGGRKEDSIGKSKRFVAAAIRPIVGGKDPLRVVEEFILRAGFDPERCLKEKSGESFRWVLEISDGRELEIFADGIRKASETTVYLGVNIVTVPLRGAHELLVAALEVADGLVGIKLSLVGHSLILSSTLNGALLSLEELEFHYSLIVAQQEWFRQALASDLGVEAALLP